MRQCQKHAQVAFIERAWVRSDEGSISELDDAEEEEAGYCCVCTSKLKLAVASL